MSDDKVKPDVPKDINPIYNNSSSFSTKTNDDTTSNNYNNNQTNNEDNTDIDFDKLFLDDNNTNKDSDLKEDFDEDDNYHSCSEDENHGSVDDNEEWSEGMEEKEMNEEKGVIDEEALKLAESKLSEEEKEERIQKSNKLKGEGNESFKGGRWGDSVELYSEAMVASLFSQDDLRSVLFSNRAAALIKLDKKQQALEDLNKALVLKPDYIRARLRRADLNEQMEKLEDALEDYKILLEVDPSLHVARAACVRLPNMITEKNEKMKQEVFGKLKELGNVVLKPFGLSTENFKVQQDPATGSYSINMQK